MTLQALVVRHPWASLIAHGIKTIETRGFAPRTTLKPGDQLAIVAGQRKADYRDPAWQPLVETVNPGMIAEPYRPLAFGAVIAVVTFDEALPMRGDDHPNNDRTPHLSGSRHEPGHLNEYRRATLADPLFDQHLDAWVPTDHADQLPLGDFTPGRYGWLLSKPRRLAAPVPCPAVNDDGSRLIMQGVFTLPASVEAAVRAGLR